jgi:Electron transfer DM13
MTRRVLALSILPLVIVAACSSAASTASPAPAASAAAMEVMSMGQLQPIDGTASGVAEIAVLPDQTYEVILDDFSIGSTDHTNVVLVSNETVTSSADIDKSMLLDLGPLKATTGMQTYVIPAEMAASVMDGYHSVVIWDTEMTHAIAAAALQ